MFPRLTAAAAVGAGASTVLTALTATGVLPFTLWEVAGFVTGAIAVWLAAKGSVWNFVVGIANNAAFVYVFLDARLYADMGLQVVYIALSVLGIAQWLYGGTNRSRRPVARVRMTEALAVAALAGAGTYAVMLYLREIGGAAPFWDALTTCASLAAMWLMVRKYVESWYVWIAVDVVYVPLYLSRDLPLTAVLYAVFLAMCVVGLVEWRRALDTRYAHGVVAGKFYPFHSGHRLLIETAVRECERVSVLVCHRGEQSIPWQVRAGWIEEAFPGVRVLEVDQEIERIDDDDSDAWAEVTRRVAGPPDAVFTSEEYGEGWAAALGCAHVLVDRDRVERPVSGTLVRAAPLAHLGLVPPSVRAHYVLRVCVLGAESTGKTSLARALAEQLGTVWVPEYGRVYSEQREGGPYAPWRLEELEHIALTQAWLEDHTAQFANDVLVCDTDLFTTALFAEELTGAPAPRVLEWAGERRYDLYVVCAMDFGFVDDGTRLEGPHRARMQRRYEEWAASRGVPVLEVSGRHEKRVAAATTFVGQELRRARARSSAAHASPRNPSQSGVSST